MIEVVIAMCVLALLFVGVTATISTTAKFNKMQLAAQQCLAAARAQLDSIYATGEPINAEKMHSLWPEVKTEITQTDAAGDWQGLKCVLVTAKAQGWEKKEIEMKLCRYFAHHGEE